MSTTYLARKINRSVTSGGKWMASAVAQAARAALAGIGDAIAKVAK